MLRLLGIPDPDGCHVRKTRNGGKVRYVFRNTLTGKY